MIKDIEKSILELENMEKSKMSKMKTINNNKKAWCSKNEGNKEFERNKNRNSL